MTPRSGGLLQFVDEVEHVADGLDGTQAGRVEVELGVELELQLVSTHDYDLAPQAEDLLRATAKHEGAWDIKPEITRSMIEIGTSIQREYAPLLAELRHMRDQVAAAGYPGFALG